jgi:UDP-N-acetylmuramoyl-tripeptide--D-alanyl-D-alanine ligase
MRGARAYLWPVYRRLAAAYRRTVCAQPRIVAVVGSFGKTTTTRAIAVGLGLQIERVSSDNSGPSLALALLRVRPSDAHGVIEVGISRVGQMKSYTRMLQPNIAVVTSIGSEHHTSLLTLETTRHEKAEMVRVLPPDGLAVLNGDDPNVRWMRGETSAKIVTFGFDEANDVRATDVQSDGVLGTRFTARTASASRALHIRLIGRHNVYPILAAIAVATEEGRSLDEVVPALESLSPASRRLEPLRSRSGALLIVDTLKSPLETVEAAIDALADRQHRPGRRIVILGEVEEPPGSLGAIYRALGERLAGLASVVLFVGGQRSFRPLRSGLREAGFPMEAVTHAGRSPRAAAESVASVLNPEDVVLIKGRSTQHLERSAYLLAGHTVTCNIATCADKQACADCPMLAR